MEHLFIAGAVIQNDETVENMDKVEAMFPGVVDKLKNVLVAENAEKKE